jgi:dUTP pyrophosphatase
MAEPIRIGVVRLPHGADLPLPKYQTGLAAGMDLLAAVAEPLTVRPLERVAAAQRISAQARHRHGQRAWHH